MTTLQKLARSIDMEILQTAINAMDRDVYESVSIDRARQTLQYLQEVVENDAEAGTASVADMITALQDLVE